MTYNIICKVTDTRFIKYQNVNNLISLCRHLDTKYPAWRYVNVYDAKSKKQIGSFTQKNKPQNKQL